jgi:branched-chain amino acid transport system substrate-binding protein
MKTKSILLNALLVVALVVAFSIPAFASGNTYKLGFSGAITGPTSDAGNPYSKGLEDWFRYVNDEKILGNDRIDCAIRDDQYQNATTKRFFEEFLDDGIVLFLSYATGANLGLKRDYEEVQIPVIPASYHEGLLDNANYIFTPVATYSENVVGLAEYVVNNHRGAISPKVAFFIHPSAFGRGPLEDTKKAMKAGLKMDIIEVVEHGKALDNTAMLKRLVSKGVRYVLCHSVQSPVATMLTDASRLGLTARYFGEKDKLTFLGAHYTGGNDLIALAGPAAEGFYWSCSYNLTSEGNRGAKKQLALAKRYGRDAKAANSHNYGAGILAAQIATEAIKNAKAADMAKGLDITDEDDLEVYRKRLYSIFQRMEFYPFVAAGPVDYTDTERVGVDLQNVYVVKNGKFGKIEAIQSKYMKDIRAAK